MSKYQHASSVHKVFLPILFCVIALSGCKLQLARVPRLRVMNAGSLPIKNLVVFFPEDRIEFGDIPAGAVTEYQDVPHGVYSYAGYQIEVDGRDVMLPVIDWIGEKPMSGALFTVRVNFDPGHLETEGGLHSALIEKDD